MRSEGKAKRQSIARSRAPARQKSLCDRGEDDRLSACVTGAFDSRVGRRDGRPAVDCIRRRYCSIARSRLFSDDGKIIHEKLKELGITKTREATKATAELQKAASAIASSCFVVSFAARRLYLPHGLFLWSYIRRCDAREPIDAARGTANMWHVYAGHHRRPDAGAGIARVQARGRSSRRVAMGGRARACWP